MPASKADIFAPPLPDERRRLRLWTGLYGSSFALAIAAAARELAAPLVVVTGDNRGAQQLEDELRFYQAERDGCELLPYPDWECLVYDRFSPHQDITSQRLRALARLPELQRGIVIVSISNLMQRTPPVEYAAGHSFSLAVGETLDVEKLRERLASAAYHAVSQVYEPGEFAVRGGLVDLFPMGSRQPFRIDLFGDVIDGIRLFDPETQRSGERVEHIDLLPAREFPMTEAGIRQFRRAWREQFPGDPQQSPIYSAISAGNVPAGAEFYLPLFHESTGTLFDYLPEGALLVLAAGTEDAAEDFRTEVAERFTAAGIDRERPPLPPQRLYLAPEELHERLDRHFRVRVVEAADPGAVVVDFGTARPDSIPVDIHAENAYRPLFDHLQRGAERVLLACETSGRRESLRQLLRDNGFTPALVESPAEFLDGDSSLALCTGRLERGLKLTSPALQIVSEAQLFGDLVFQRRARSRPARDPDAVIRSLADVNVGDPVIHETQGVGRYIGLQSLDIQGATTEFLTIEYQDGDKLYVPVMSLHLVSRYTGMSPEAAPLHRLGGKEWEKNRRKAQQKAYDAAVELLAVQALRDARQGIAFPPPDTHYLGFAAGFPFEETPDQAKAIEDVIADMTAERPMDRLVCGDVGFGKTEVALRAAFIAAHGGYQVAVVVPTTLLAQQHFENFSDRFSDFAVRVELLSRFRTRKEAEGVLTGLANGSVDIIIGTHRLLQKDIRFKRLGLMIIDEEQRFGVRHKEELKKKRSQVDILTLSATPIPRTLNLSLSGLRDISIIATPPQRRLTIRTFVSEWSDSLIREGFLREIHRGGQVYFLHNEVRSMEAMLARLEAAIPEARIRIAHGQMSERELERIMQDFYHQRFNVLLCTTIIESGIDIPSANTIFINRGDRFGLAQLHQLRGRVGRSHHQAYCYVMVPSHQAMTADAERRLGALEQLDELGAGFALAMSDMEIRGTGELLGESQSGMIDEVGFTLYTELLNRAIRSLKSGRAISADDIESGFESGTEIDLAVPALLPQDYLPDVHMRLIMYKRIANARDDAELYELQIEMIDRFGLLPPEAKQLFALTSLRLKAVALGIDEIRIGREGGRLRFGKQPAVDPLAIIRLIQSRPREFRMDGPQTLHWLVGYEDAAARVTRTGELLETLASSTTD